MLTDAPDPLEVVNFRFRQMRKLCMTQGDEKIPAEAVNLVAISSRYGLVFVGIQGGFKVLKLENIFDINEDEEKRKEAHNFPCQKVISPTPCLLALSTDDMTLAVCVTRDSCAVADMYDIRAFADQEEMPLPFTNVRLSSDNNVKLRDLMWNPVVVEMYAFCLSDGSLHIHELAEKKLKIAANLPPQTNATAVCWSPKGKELVVGKKSGIFTRHKPTLQEVKNFLPPAGLDENSVEVVSIYWISTTLFAVVYISADPSNEKTPSLVFVSTPKGVEATYSNFGDVCYGGASDREPRYMMHYDPEWKTLTCVSSNSVESAVIGCSGEGKPIWHQWILDDSGRADVPLVRNEEPSPIGMGVIYCAQRKIIISDTESYPPMPVLFLLSTSGLLCPFHVLNTTQGAANLVYPSEPICREGERRSNGNAKLQAGLEPQKSSIPALPANGLLKIVQPQTDMFPTNSNVIPAVPLASVNSSTILPSQAFSVAPNTALESMQAFMTPQANSFSFTQSQTSQKVLPAPKTASSITFESVKPLTISPIPQAFAAAKTFSVIPCSGMSIPPTQSSVTQVSSPVCPSEQTSKKFAGSTVPQPSVEAVSAQSSQLPQSSFSAYQDSAEAMQSPELVELSDPFVMKAVMEEVADFNREIQELKELAARGDEQVGTPEEMAYLKKTTLLIEEFHDNMKTAVKTLNSEIASLKNLVLESYALLSEAESQEKRLKDPKYLSILREKPLDPIRSRQMQKIQQLSQYLATQLGEVNDRLDSDWQEFIMLKKSAESSLSKPRRLPSLETIYRIIVSNQNIIHNQKVQLERLGEILNKQKWGGQARGMKIFRDSKLEISDSELGELADTLLQTKISKDGEKNETVHPPRRTLTLEQQAPLREFLANRKVRVVKSKAVFSLTDSRLCSRLPMRTISLIDLKKTYAGVAHNADEKAESSEPVSVHEPVSESVPSHEQVPSAQPFTTKPTTIEAQGGITQGVPMTKTLNKPASSMIPSRVLNSEKPVAFKAVPNSSPESSSSLAKSPSQSAFIHLAPASSKPVIESPKPLPLQGNAGKAIASQNFFQQKPVSKSGFISVSNLRSGPERPFAPTFALSESTKEINSQNTFSSSSLGQSSSVLETENIGNRVYEDISPPDSPHLLSDDEYEAAQLPAKDQLKISETVPVREVSKTVTVQSTSEEKLITKPPPTDLKSAPFFFSPVPGVKTSFVSAQDAPQLRESEVPNHPAVIKSSEVASSPPTIAVPSDFQQDETVISVSQQQQNVNASLKQPITSTPPASVPGTEAPKAQGIVTFSQDSAVSPSASIIQSSSSTNQKESCSVVRQAESAFASLKVSPTAAASVSSQPVQRGLGKVAAAFTFSLPAQDQNDQKEAKKADVVTPTIVPTSAVSAASSTSSPVNAPVVEPSATNLAAEMSASLQKTVFVSVSSSTGSSSASVFGKPAPIAPAGTTAAQAVFGQTTSVNTSSDIGGGAFGLTAAAAASSSSIFGLKTVANAATTTTTVTTTTATTPSTLPFFGQQPMTQTSFFGKTTLTSVFGQSPQAQSSVFGQTVNSATSSASSPFSQAGTGGFFSQSSSTSVSSVFGQKVQSPGSPPAFGQTSPASGFSFQKASMEQQTLGSFGLAKSVFGQNSGFCQQQQQTTSTTSPFGQPSSSPGGVFGQGSFFSGLGGKPSEENASKNVFASSISSPNANSGIFGNQGASSFSAKLGGSFSGGSFSSGSGTVAQSGFGAFQQTPQKTSGFGAPPSFGGSPTFGSSPSFGGSPGFGSGIAAASPLGGSTFGATQADGFGSFASSNSPTFGTLASQTGGFGGTPQQQTPTFGSLSPQSPPPSAFGSGPVFGGSPGFGAPAQQSTFGNPTNTTQSSAFSQWRN